MRKHRRGLSGRSTCCCHYFASMGSTGSCRARTTAMTPELRLHGVDLERDGGRGSEAPTFTATILARAPAPPSFHPPLRSIVSIWHLVYILCVELLHSISKQPQGMHITCLSKCLRSNAAQGMDT